MLRACLAMLILIRSYRVDYTYLAAEKWFCAAATEQALLLAASVRVHHLAEC
jgi:hypothetical protein